MDYLLEAEKFVQRARNAADREVVSQDLEMAAWCLKQAREERKENQLRPGPTRSQMRPARPGR